jgi:NADPH:quinone reductase-like Zn-dependent oxidoreductase
MGFMMAQPSTADLTLLAGMVESGKLKAVIDRTYKLEQIAEAVRYVEEGHARGKVIIIVD